MALRDWVTATATLAISATVKGEKGRSVATVATVAVAGAANDGLQTLATPAQAAELRSLVASFLADDNDAERADATTAALADPDAALTSFRLLAAEYQQKHPPGPPEPCGPYTSVSLAERDPSDDRRTCSDCANLTAREHHCLAAWRGERPGNAACDYRPIADLLQRCERYQPKPSEVNQRPGAERWPYLLVKQPEALR